MVLYKCHVEYKEFLTKYSVSYNNNDDNNNNNSKLLSWKVVAVSSKNVLW